MIADAYNRWLNMRHSDLAQSPEIFTSPERPRPVNKPTAAVLSPCPTCGEPRKPPVVSDLVAARLADLDAAIDCLVDTVPTDAVDRAAVDAALRVAEARCASLRERWDWVLR